MNIDVGLLSIIVLGIMLIMLLTGLPVTFVLLSLSVIGFWYLRGLPATSSIGLGFFSIRHRHPDTGIAGLPRDGAARL